MSKKFTKEMFIKRANLIHNNKYDYSKFVYINNSTKSTIICPIHGEFMQTPSNHYKQNCRECAIKKKNIDKINSFSEKFVYRANKVHNKKYNYEKFNYIGDKVPSIIICPIHGEFIQNPNSHLNGYGCSKCGYKQVADKQRKNIDEFISQANLIHDFKYDYSKFEYYNSKTKSIIICPIHGEFLKDSIKHLSRGQGCPSCSKESLRSKGEESIYDYLCKNNIKFKEQFRFKDKYMNNKPYDFLLNDLNTLIEYQGEQHFKIKFNMTEKDLAERKALDSIKNKFAIVNGYNFLEIKYNDNIKDVLDNFFSSTTIEK